MRLVHQQQRLRARGAEASDWWAHLAMASCVLYCTPSTKGTGASRRGIMELGVTGMRRHCHLGGRGVSGKVARQGTREGGR